MALQKIIQTVGLAADDLLVEPTAVAAAEDDQAVILLVHDLAGLEEEFFEFEFAQLAFEDGVLNPIEILAAKLEHLCHSLFSHVINEDNVHHHQI